MAAPIGALLVELSANTAAFRSDMGKATAILSSSQARMNRSLAQIDKGFALVAKSAAVFGLGLGVGAILNFSKRAFDAVGGLGELSQQLGISTDSLQTFQFAATQSGVAAGAMESAIARFTRTIGDARAGSDEAVKAVRALGPAFERAVAGGASTDRLLLLFADQIAGIGDKSVAAARGADLMGEGFQKMVPLFSGGSAAIAAMSAEMERLGMKATPEMIGQADIVADKIAALSFEAEKFAQILIVKVAPAMASALRGWSAILSGPDIGQRMVELTRQEIETEDRLNKMRAARPGSFPREVLEQQEQRLAAIRRQIEALREEGKKQVAALDAVPPDMDRPGGSKSVGGALVGRSELKKRQEEMGRLAQAERELQDEANEATNEYLRAVAARQSIFAQADDEIEANRKLAAALGKGTAEYERQAEVLRILGPLRAQGIGATDAEMDRAKQQAAILVEQRREIERKQEAFRTLENFGERAFDRLGQAATIFGRDSENAFLNLRDIAHSVIVEIQEELLKLAILNPLKNWVFGSNSPTLGDFGLGGGGSSGIVEGDNPLSGMQDWLRGFPFFADGTNSAPRGLAVVGEDGPELVSFRGGERVFDHEASMDMLGGARESAPVFYVDNRGASLEAVARLEHFVGKLNGSIEPRAVNAVRDAQMRGAMAR